MEPVVRLIPLGGLGEIGPQGEISLNMRLVESGEVPGIDHVIPDFSYAAAARGSTPLS